jgi:hypothetical protein
MTQILSFSSHANIINNRGQCNKDVGRIFSGADRPAKFPYRNDGANPLAPMATVQFRRVAAARRRQAAAENA